MTPTQPPACGKISEIRARDADSTVTAATDGPWYFAGAPKSRLYEIRTKLCDNPGSGCKRGELICRHVERAADANLIAHAVETALDRRTLLRYIDELLSHRHPAPVADERDVDRYTSLGMAFTKLRGCADGSTSYNNWIALTHPECTAVLAHIEALRQQSAEPLRPAPVADEQAKWVPWKPGDALPQIHKDRFGWRNLPITVWCDHPMPDKPGFQSEVFPYHFKMGRVVAYWTGAPIPAYDASTIESAQPSGALERKKATWCVVCRSEIDPDTCGCGEAIVDGIPHGDHSPIPMGCNCYRERPAPPERAPGGDAASYHWGNPPFPRWPAETVDSMAEIGEAFMEALPKDYSWCQSPSEIIADLQNQLDDASATPPPSSSPSATADATLRAALEEAQGCFAAADIEGWSIAILGDDMERVRDLWNRRIHFAWLAIDAALAGNEGK